MAKKLKGTKKVSIDLTDEKMKKLDIICIAKGITRNDFINQCVDEVLEKNFKKILKDFAVGSSGDEMSE